MNTNYMHLSLILACLLIGQAVPLTAQSVPQRPAPARDGQRDFDFEIGTWKTDLKRLAKPMSGNTEWLTYTGTSKVTKVLGGRANMVELDVTGPSGRIEGVSLRLYNPEKKTWSLNFANARSGELVPPSVGSFDAQGRGEFYSNETYNGKPVIVRFLILPISRDSIRFVQAYSADGGKTWEDNWIAIDTRTGP